MDLRRIEREFDFETAQMNEDRMRRLLAQQIRAQQNASLQAEEPLRFILLRNLEIGSLIEKVTKKESRPG